ncbi:hypothetical protein [Dechloromonas denitrificans]|uniref:hypothetical protein n=1 Tax=Azonexaceae TaxID=2008795 RepID=UPI001CF85EEE|nr:hypothetical protein [Dechloromonas denitrificans]
MAEPKNASLLFDPCAMGRLVSVVVGVIAFGFCIPPSALSMHNYGMYIIAIGWLYVTVLVAANEPSVIAGIISFFFYGLLPCGLLLWISGSKVRRQRRAYRESLANERLNDGDRSDPEADK